MSKSKNAESIKVVFRVRPLNAKEKQQGRRVAAIAHETSGVVELRPPDPDDAADGAASKTFTFDAVFSERSTQRHVYDVCAAPVVESVLQGYNGTVFAYGQTGAGKSHTMEGANAPPSARGVIPNSFEHIFDHIALHEGDARYLVRASYFEIYNEEIRDLLSDDDAPARGLELKEADSGVYVKDLKSVVVKSVSEIDKVLQRGKANRSVGATLMNAGSSRSHSIFSIVVECCTSDGRAERIRAGKLNLVDLAGSERQSKTGATGDRLKEATKINLSLSALGNCISALADGTSRHIPYRDSKLTRVLQDSLGGNTKTVMCANAGPADYNYDESLSTLRYAKRAKKIKNQPIINEDPKDTMLREYQEEIARLKKSLSEMPASAASTERDQEIILERAKSSEILAHTEAEMDKLRLSNDRTVEEHTALQQKLADEKEARRNTETQRLEMQKQLAEMETQLMIGGEIAGHAAKQEAALRKANQELIAKRESELALARKMSEQEEEKFELEEKFNSLHEEVSHKTKKLKKLFAKYQQAKAEIKDLEAEFLADRADLLDSVRVNEQQLKLKDFIISNYIPPKYALLYDSVENGGRAVWDETHETWKIPPLTHQGNIIKERIMSKNSRHRPETDYAKRRATVDPNPRFRTDNIVDLDLILPEKHTPARDDPNTPAKIAAILAMDLDDPPAHSRRATNRENQYFSVSDHTSKSKSKRRKEKAKHKESKSRRPVTAL